MQKPSPPVARFKPTARSRMSNGSMLLAGVDGRSTWARRMRDLLKLHISDLGGDDNISEAERSIVRRAAVLTTELEMMEQRFALAGSANDEQLALYASVANSLRRLLESVGLKRRARDITLHPLDYARSNGRGRQPRDERH